jgi:hypothetical protein
VRRQDRHPDAPYKYGANNRPPFIDLDQTNEANAAADTSKRRI